MAWQLRPPPPSPPHWSRMKSRLVVLIDIKLGRRVFLQLKSTTVNTKEPLTLPCLSGSLTSSSTTTFVIYLFCNDHRDQRRPDPIECMSRNRALTDLTLMTFNFYILWGFFPYTFTINLTLLPPHLSCFQWPNLHILECIVSFGNKIDLSYHQLHISWFE